MASSVKSRRNHYQTLGLKPGASDDDVAAAFATESRKIIQNPRVNEPDVREQARAVRAAHQTLRDPDKRAAYDASIGFGAKAPAKAPDAPAEPPARPFVAAPSDQPHGDPSAASDEHIAPAAADSPEAGRGRRARNQQPRPRPEQTNASTGLPEGLFVAGMAATAAKAEAKAEPPQAASEPEAPVGAAPADAHAPPEAAEAFAAPPPQAEARPEAPSEPQLDSAADPAPEPSAEGAYRFQDPGAGTAALYGQGRGRKFNRAATGGVAALAAALAVGAFWMWPSQTNQPPADVPTGSATASTNEPALPTDVLDGLPSAQGAGDPDPFATTELADAGSYQSVTFSDSGPIPTSGAPPSSSPIPPAPAADDAAASPPAAAADQDTATAATTAPPAAASAAPSAASTAAPAAAAPVIANAPPRVQRAPDLRPVTPPKLVRGTLLNSDNRRGALQGTVSVRFLVGANGRATGCSPTASSGSVRLDAYTCELVQQRLQFDPAVTAQGQPVASEMRATYTWGRKRRTLTGRLLDIVR